MSSSTNTSPDLFACPDCDLLIRNYQQVEIGHALYCPRCGCLLLKRSAHSIEKTLAFSLLGILLLFPSLLLPLIKFDAFGFSDSGNVLESVSQLFAAKYYIVATMVALFSVVFPGLVLIFAFTISFQLFTGISSASTARLFRFYLRLNEWAMLEVYLLGILVAMIKMLPIASISYFSGFFCFIAVTLSVVCISATIDKAWFWYKIEQLAPQKASGVENKTVAAESAAAKMTTACGEGLLLCHDCRKLFERRYEGENCSRCGATLHLRKPQSRQRTWALVLAAALLLLPANLLPIMEVDLFGMINRSTIMDGIIYFFKEGSYFVGGVILVASILVPLFKVIGLVILLLVGQGRPTAFLSSQTRFYRFISFIGRWSMLDIFVIALLAATVNFGFVSSTLAAPAVRWFCLVVTVTMFAAGSFDPRLMWDKSQPIS